MRTAHEGRHLRKKNGLIRDENIGCLDLDRRTIPITPFGFGHQRYEIRQLARPHGTFVAHLVLQAALSVAVALKSELNRKGAFDDEIARFQVEDGWAARRRFGMVAVHIRRPYPLGRLKKHPVLLIPQQPSDTRWAAPVRLVDHALGYPIVKPQLILLARKAKLRILSSEDEITTLKT